MFFDAYSFIQYFNSIDYPYKLIITVKSPFLVIIVDSPIITQLSFKIYS